MSTNAYILFPHGATWQIATVNGGHATLADMLPPEGDVSKISPQAIAERLKTELDRLGYAGQGVMLALSSADCWAASIDIAGLPRGDRKAMLYRLEEKLPMAAESIVADFAIGDARALGVCVREDAVSPLLHSLESHGVAVQSICAATFLAAQQLAEGTGPQILLIGEDDQINVIAIHDGVPTSWSLLPNQPAVLRLHLDVLLMELGDETVPIRSSGVPAVMVQNLNVKSVPVVPRQVAAIGGAAILESRLKPWIEFRRGALSISDPLRLHRRALEVLLGAAAIFLVCTTLGFLWRIHRYNEATTTANSRMSNEFLSTFPTWSVPSNLKTIVEGEHRKLVSRGAAGVPAEVNHSAMELFHGVLSRLPVDLKFKLESMSFHEDLFELQGRVRTYGDLETIAAATRLSGMDVPPPQAHRDAEGFWSFTLRGTRPPRPPAVARQ